MHQLTLPGRPAGTTSASSRGRFFKKEKFWVMPSSVSPTSRIPLFWLAFKNLPLWFIKQYSLQTLAKDKYPSLYFHPWEFADPDAYHTMPFYTRCSSGKALLNNLSAYLDWLKSIAGFCTIENFINHQQLR